MLESAAGPPQTPLPSSSSLAGASLVFQREVTLPQVTLRVTQPGTTGRKLHQIKFTKKYYFLSLAGNSQKIWSAGWTNTLH